MLKNNCNKNKQASPASVTNYLQIDDNCGDISREKALNFSTPLTYNQASYILEITRHWDFTPERGKPRCLSKLRSASLRPRRSLMNSVAEEGGDR